MLKKYYKIKKRKGKEKRIRSYVRWDKGKEGGCYRGVRERKKKIM